MIKNILGGIIVGISNIIPGVSGGTLMVILGLFDRVVGSVSNIFKLRNPNWMKDVLFLIQILVGIGIGMVSFAKIVDWLFTYYQTQTLFWFIGMLLMSIPFVIKSELKDNKISWIQFLSGILIILIAIYFNPGESNILIEVFPSITLLFLIKMVVIGMITGATMILPGVSGSMVLLIIDEYYLFKSYVANVTSIDINILIPLCFIGMGVGLGILLSAKLIKHFLEKHRRGAVSFILGLIVGSSVMLIPVNANFDLFIVITSISTFIVGAMVLFIIEHLV